MRILFLLPCFLLLACDPKGDANNAVQGQDAAGTNAQPVNDRDRWQKPEVVIALMDNIQGIVVADLFADDGYFTFKFIEGGANVIAVVNEPEKAERLDAEKKKRGLSDERLQIRLVPMGDPGLRTEEADMAFIAHRFVSIKDKRGFFKQMRNGLRFPRYLVMLEWQNRETAMGPPMSERLPSDRIMDMIGEISEYTDVGAHSDKIPDQVVFLINDYMDTGGDEGYIEVP